MSNAQRRSKNVEVGIRVLTQMVLLKDLGTWYFVLGTLFLILKRIYTLYFVLCTKKKAARKSSLFLRKWIRLVQELIKCQAHIVHGTYSWVTPSLSVSSAVE